MQKYFYKSIHISHLKMNVISSHKTVLYDNWMNFAPLAFGCKVFNIVIFLLTKHSHFFFFKYRNTPVEPPKQKGRCLLGYLLDTSHSCCCPHYECGLLGVQHSQQGWKTCCILVHGILDATAWQPHPCIDNLYKYLWERKKMK